ncbi:MAG: pantetheine-phosphate adenylyltransferase [Prevotella sp.]|nr:pantetheine-phosphate adenylyltransferase [Prevotella sp.]
MKTGIFTGSFDPFTVGHDNIVRRALPLFDRLVIGIGINERKQYMTPADERLQHLKQVYAGEPRIEVESYNGLTIDFARRHQAQFIVKGVRSVKDFEYEREVADGIYQLTGIDTLLLYADPKWAFLSSSMVRELIHFGKDVTPFIL